MSTREPARSLPQLAVACPTCGSPAGELCTSHGGTRTRRIDTHQARLAAWGEAGKIRPIEDEFFQPGRTYAHGQTSQFRVEHVTRHPDHGHLRAIGWMKTGEPGAKWHGGFRDEGEFKGWIEIADGGDAVQGEAAQPAEVTIYRASHDSIVMGLYTTRDAAQTHCEAKVRQEEPEGSIQHLSWWADDTGDQAEYELHITPADPGALIHGTGYVVKPLTVAAAYDPDGDE